MTGFEIISPRSLNELCELLEELRHSPYRFGAGYTDLMMELRKGKGGTFTVINLSRIEGGTFCAIQKQAGGYELGAMVTANEILRHSGLCASYPVMQQAAWNLASAQIRNVATIGGNLCTASPSGDLIAAVMSLNARCRIMDHKANLREVGIQEFFTGVRSTSLQKNEFLYSVFIPDNESEQAQLQSGFIKVGTRKAMECSVVSLAWHVQLDVEKRVLSAGIAIGAVAPTVQSTAKACEYLTGKKWGGLTQAQEDEFVQAVLEYASPISDLRASAWYRMEVLANISRSILHQ